MGYRRCEATTAKGVRCKGGAIAGTPHCGPHQDTPVVAPLKLSRYGEIEAMVCKIAGDMVTEKDGTVTVPTPAIELMDWWTKNQNQILEMYGH